VLYNANPRETEANIKLTLDGVEFACETVSVPGRETFVAQLTSFTAGNLRLWDGGKGELYRVEYTTETDDLIDRVGFRKIEVKDGKLLLNNREIEIRGVNRHHDHPDFGMAFPPARMKHDIDLICDLGCNAIRGSHYPNSRDFVDMLDERGILFWSEIPIWGGGFSQAALGDEKVVKRGLMMLGEMVDKYYNHPSIIIWGMHNEILTDTKEALEMSKTYYGYLKATGGNRAVVFASDKPLIDICFEFSDIICLNQYYGWYSGGLNAWEPFFEKFCERLKTLGLENKPIIMSEFGAGGLYGFHDAEMPQWSEEYQAKLIDFCLNFFHKHPAIVGSFIWQFCDIRTAKEMGFGRARGFNNKGIMNEYRRPKAAYYAVQKCYRSFKTT
jgi:beta-glucuronidase